jgi:LysM repeat protein
MSQSKMRRVGAMLAVIMLLSVILVPAAAAAPVAGTSESANQGTAGCPVYYRVVRGDNLTVIAWRYGVSVNQLMRWNNISNPDRVYVGQVLVIWPPRCTMPAPKPPKPPAPKPPPLPGPCSGSQCPPVQNPAWRATYYNTVDLSGPIVVDRQERRPCFNCGWSGPVAGVNADRWSARWTTSSYAVGGTYRLNVKSDDGVRVFIDGVPVLNEWRVQAVRGFFVDVVIPRGWHTWTVEYFEDTGVSEMCFEAVLLTR